VIRNNSEEVMTMYWKERWRGTGIKRGGTRNCRERVEEAKKRKETREG